MADGKSSENISDIHKKITAAFNLFDKPGSNNTVDVREIGPIMCSLGCVPSEADIQEFIAKVEEPSSRTVHLDRFLPAMTIILLENKFPSIPRRKIVQAFKVLDKDQKGYLQPEELAKYMTKGDEPFNEEEMNDVLTAHTHQEDNVIYYEKLINKLTTGLGK